MSHDKVCGICQPNKCMVEVPSKTEYDAHNHSSIITEGDNRNIATTPSDYNNEITFVGLKNNPIIDNPSTDAHSYIVGLRGWTSNGGGYAHEIAFTNSGIFVRKGANDTTWNAWKEVNTSGNEVPIGSIVPYTGTTAPDGWLICNGQWLSRTTYSKLYSVVGDTYKENYDIPDTQFRIPDLHGRVPIGVSSSHALGTIGGEETHTLTVNEMPSHSHGITIHTMNGDVNPSIVSGASESYGSGSASTNNAGGGAAHNNMQPYIVLNYIIRAK